MAAVPLVPVVETAGARSPPDVEAATDLGPVGRDDAPRKPRPAFGRVTVAHVTALRFLREAKTPKLARQICSGTCPGPLRFDVQAVAFYGVIATRKRIPFRGGRGGLFQSCRSIGSELQSEVGRRSPSPSAAIGLGFRPRTTATHKNNMRQFIIICLTRS